MTQIPMTLSHRGIIIVEASGFKTRPQCLHELAHAPRLQALFFLDLCGNPVRAVAHEGVRIFVFVSCTPTLKGGTYGYSNRPLGPAHGHRPVRADDTRHLRNAV